MTQAYKFRSAAQIAYAFDIIINKRLYCSDWRNLNDPMEGLFTYGTNAGNEPEASQKVKGIVKAKKQYKVCSLAGTFDSHLLWSHYAGGFDGVAIEINLPQSHHIRPIEYRGVFAYVDMNEFTSEEEAAKQILFSKNQEWAYEKEIRILHDNEWFELDRPVSKVIAGHRMPRALFDVLNITCNSLGITFNKVGIGDEGIDADYVEPPAHIIPINVFKQKPNTSRRP